MGISSQYNGPKEVRYLFVDAGCLRVEIAKLATRYLGSNQHINIDWQLLRAGHGKVFYYDAVPSRDREEDHASWQSRIEPRMSELRDIRKEDGYHVPLGDLRGKTARQKKVDVMIAVDMLLHTMRRNMHACTLLAGDSDFQPLLEALVREGMKVTLWHPQQAPDDLVGAADSHVRLDESTILQMALRPDGTRLQPQQSSGVRPHPIGLPELEWKDGPKELVLRSHKGQWLLENYDAQASATSIQLMSTDPCILLNAAIDLWKIDIPNWAFEKAQLLESRQE